MSEDTQTLPVPDGELFWNAQVAAWPRLDRRFFTEYADTGEDFRKATEAGVKAVADAVRARVTGPLEAMLASWRKQLRNIDADPRQSLAGHAVAETLRVAIRQAEEAVNAALKEGAA